MRRNKNHLNQRIDRLIKAAAMASRRALPTQGASMRGFARWLELRSFSLTPEYFTPGEGLRAALAVAFPFCAIAFTGRLEPGWAVFAAFWTCLCDGAGPHRMRWRLLLGFVVVGAVNTFFGAWLSSFRPGAGMAVGPALVFLSIFLPSRFPQTGLLATLLAVVAVVAVGFPHPLHGALVQAGAFLAGSIWAWVLINVVWRIDEYLPVDQASKTVLARLSDMAADLTATEAGQHRVVKWYTVRGEHRRAVRTALERLRGLLARYDREPHEKLTRFHARLDEAETAFSALIALEHIFIVKTGSASERIGTAQAAMKAITAWIMASSNTATQYATLQKQIAHLRDMRKTLSDDTLRGCLIGIEEALLAAANRMPPTVKHIPVGSTKATDWRMAIQQALRQCIGVIVVNYIADLFGLGYPYWAAMAVVVVMQGAVRITWTRSIERIFGSLLGGILALYIFHLLPWPRLLPIIATALAGVTITLRMVNYTVFVVFLTVLFILVTEFLQPGVGIASARILDNTLGSLAALVSMFALWPNFGPPFNVLLQRGLEANRDYIVAVTTRQDAPAIAAARRSAGLASIEAEVALHDLGGFQRHWRGFSKEVDATAIAAIKELRRLAGETATEWHRHLGLKERLLTASNHHHL